VSIQRSSDLGSEDEPVTLPQRARLEASRRLAAAMVAERVRCSRRQLPRKSAGSVRGSTQVMMYRPLNGRKGRRGVLRHSPLLAKALLRSISAVMFDMASPFVVEVASRL
jgi:hypothetical protein